MRKTFFCETFLFRQSKKACSIIWSTWVFFAFLEKKRPNKYCSWKVNLVFHIKRFSTQSVNLFWVLVVFPPIFVVDTKIIYSYDFVAPLMMIMIFSFFVYLIHFFFVFHFAFMYRCNTTLFMPLKCMKKHTKHDVSNFYKTCILSIVESLKNLGLVAWNTRDAEKGFSIESWIKPTVKQYFTHPPPLFLPLPHHLKAQWCL